MKWNLTGWRAALGGAAAAAVLALGACGGGEQVQQFHAKRVFAFGDETSVINSDGSKYSINALDATTGALDCASNPLWIQTVASIYGLVFPQCNPTAVPSPVSRIYAVPGARVADLAGQIDQQIANGAFADGDLATVLVGANDIIDQFQQVTTIGEGQARANLEQAGAALAAQVNRLADLGVKVIVSTTPNMGITPFAGDPAGANAALLSRLSDRFNISMYANIYNDGRRIGLVYLDQYTVTVRTYSTNVGFVNSTLAACLPSAPLPTCTTATLGTDAAAVPPPATPASASATTWLWADDRHLSAGGQASLGSLAATRAQNNPF
jgi:hypothetical protein